MPLSVREEVTGVMATLPLTDVVEAGETVVGAAAALTESGAAETAGLP